MSEMHSAENDALRERMEALADQFDAKGRRGSAHFGADIGDTIRLWIERDPRAASAREVAEWCSCDVNRQRECAVHGEYPTVIPPGVQP